MARHRKIPYIPGLEQADCGPACLAMALAHHGRNVPLGVVRDAVGSGSGGTTAVALIHGARYFGLAARGVKADIGALPQLPRGSVLHWNFQHFVVLDRVRQHAVDIVDPAIGHVRIPYTHLRRAYTGVALVLSPTPALTPQPRSSAALLRHLRPMLRGSGDLRRVIVTSLLLRLFALAVPLLTALLVNHALPEARTHLLTAIVLTVATLTGYHLATGYLRARLLLQLRTRLNVRMTTAFVRHLVGLPYAFFLRRASGDLMMRLKSTAVVRDSLTNGAVSAVLDGGFAAFYLLALMVLSPPLGLLAATLGGLQAAVLAATWRRNKRLAALSLSTEARSQSYVYQLLAGIEVLKASGAEHRAADTWQGLFLEETNAAVARGRLAALADTLVATLRFASPLAVLLVGGYQVLAGHLPVGTMLALAALATGFLEPLVTLITTGFDLAQIGSYIDRFNDVLDTPAERSGPAVHNPGPLTGRITADRVTYRYSRAAEPVIRDVTLEILPGQQVAIVGPSGSGKSTLAHLLLGLYSPESGTIRYDGISLAHLDIQAVRRQIGIVTQNAYVFGTSVRDNISLADPAISPDAVRRAAELACIHDDIGALPMGYETLLSAGGASLSGGQRQRIALARALVQQPAILLLDEATSALDPATERRVHANLDTLDCTRIVIAHSLGTVTRADTIVVMDRGTIAEHGTHTELMQNQGLYHHLVTSEIGNIWDCPQD